MLRSKSDRFPIMERNYFTENVSKTCLLTVDEILKVYQSFDDEKIDMFPTKRRNVEHLVCHPSCQFNGLAAGWILPQTLIASCYE